MTVNEYKLGAVQHADRNISLSCYLMLILMMSTLTRLLIGIGPNSCVVCSDADRKGPLCHLPGREALLARWTLRQRERWVRPNSRQTPGQTGSRASASSRTFYCDSHHAALFSCCDCVRRTTTALCRGSFWGSTNFLLAWRVLMSPPVCQSMECWQSLCQGHLPAQSVLFQFPVKMDQPNRKCRAVTCLSFHY